MTWDPNDQFRFEVLFDGVVDKIGKARDSLNQDNPVDALRKMRSADEGLYDASFIALSREPWQKGGPPASIRNEWYELRGLVDATWVEIENILRQAVTDRKVLQELEDEGYWD